MKKRSRKVLAIIKYKEKNPSLTLQEIGTHFKSSRQYIHKVLKQNDISTYRIPRNPFKNYRRCLICGELSTKLVHDGSCHFQYYTIKLTCSFCRVPYYRKKAAIEQAIKSGYRKNYCSHQCYRKDRGGE